jgi:hypothetical protein
MNQSINQCRNKSILDKKIISKNLVARSKDPKWLNRGALYRTLPQRRTRKTKEKLYFKVNDWERALKINEEMIGTLNSTSCWQGNLQKRTKQIIASILAPGEGAPHCPEKGVWESANTALNIGSNQQS